MTEATFHGDDVRPSPPENALFHVLPVPLEKTVSYQSGTSLGPSAILEASCQLELFDNYSVPAEHGIFTAQALDCTPPIREVLSNLADRVAAVVDCGAIPVSLGGEHSLTYGCVRGIKAHYENFGVIQFDAHADLRDSYGGSRQSHASVMRRVIEKDIPLLQIGTRSYSLEEHKFRQQQQIIYYDAETIWRQGAKTVMVPDDFPDKIYLTFDIDCFDAPIMPATGTPVPGGLDWYQTAAILRTVLENRVCLGFDVVELAPQKEMHGASFTAAQLTYNIMGYLTRSIKNRSFYSLKK